MNATIIKLKMRMNDEPNIVNSSWFSFSAGVVLAITGLAKVWIAYGNTKVLAVPEPVTGIQFSNVLLIIGMVECLIACICFFRQAQKLSLMLVAWLATNFVIYRLDLWWIGWKHPCSCLGNLTDALHIPTQTADTTMKIVLAYLLIGSYVSLFWLWRQRKRVSSAVGPVSV